MFSLTKTSFQSCYIFSFQGNTVSKTVFGAVCFTVCRGRFCGLSAARGVCVSTASGADHVAKQDEGVQDRPPLRGQPAQFLFDLENHQLLWLQGDKMKGLDEEGEKLQIRGISKGVTSVVAAVFVGYILLSVSCLRFLPSVPLLPGKLRFHLAPPSLPSHPAPVLFPFFPLFTSFHPLGISIPRLEGVLQPLFQRCCSLLWLCISQCSNYHCCIVLRWICALLKYFE